MKRPQVLRCKTCNMPASFYAGTLKPGTDPTVARCFCFYVEWTREAPTKRPPKNKNNP